MTNTVMQSHSVLSKWHVKFQRGCSLGDNEPHATSKGSMMLPKLKRGLTTSGRQTMNRKRLAKERSETPGLRWYSIHLSAESAAKFSHEEWPAIHCQTLVLTSPVCRFGETNC